MNSYNNTIQNKPGYFTLGPKETYCLCAEGFFELQQPVWLFQSLRNMYFNDILGLK